MQMFPIEQMRLELRLEGKWCRLIRLSVSMSAYFLNKTLTLSLHSDVCECLSIDGMTI